MTNSDMLIGQITRTASFSNKYWTAEKPAGTHVAVRASRIEAGARYVYAYLPGTRYSAMLPVSMIEPV
jgi:ABC-type transport system involved in cytochrome bd biosynthesis fused ATPase/permease subunit